HLAEKEITLMVGPRQSGKTTLMLLLQQYLQDKGEKTLFLNLDIESDRRYFSSQNDLLNKIKLEVGRGKAFIFIDEIQRKEDAGLFLKGIYDMNLDYKFIVSGSGSLELKERVHESLAGRKRVFEVSTINFLEFVNFKTEYKYEDRLPNFFKVEKDKAIGLLQEYLSFGGYPRVILEDTLDGKRRTIDEIYQSYLMRDISYLLRVEKIDSFSNLVKILASQSGKLANLSELSQTLAVSTATLRNYLWYLEKTFILNKVTPYFKNVRKEITKSPIYYFSDLGLRNYALGTFDSFAKEKEGFLFQNFVFAILREKIEMSTSKINFWRTKDGAEVDFVVSSGLDTLPIEVKYSSVVKPTITRSLRSFIEKYRPKEAFVVDLETTVTLMVGETKVKIISFGDFLTMSI
ncbi:MAG: ATP-binding protein, partial [Patescibacteria group bacterium]